MTISDHKDLLFYTLAATPLEASRGTIESGGIQPFTVEKSKSIENWVKGSYFTRVDFSQIVKNHPWTYEKLHSKGEPYQSSG